MRVEKRVSIFAGNEKCTKFSNFIALYFSHFTLRTGHYLYPGLGLKRNYFELKNYVYPTINNRKFSKTPPFISLKNNYPTFANTFVILPIFSSPLLGILL